MNEILTKKAINQIKDRLIYPENDNYSIVESIKNAAKEIESWPKWKQDLCGIESDYSITSIDLNKLNNKKETKNEDNIRTL